jgi:hypothetical protein
MHVVTRLILQGKQGIGRVGRRPSCREGIYLSVLRYQVQRTRVPGIDPSKFASLLFWILLAKHPRLSAAVRHSKAM